MDRNTTKDLSIIMLKGLFIASTGKDIGKTTLSLGLCSGLKKRGFNIAYMKPIGQEIGKSGSDSLVDKDVVLLKEHFQLEDLYQDMSPVLITPGFTKDFLDKKFETKDLLQPIIASFQKLIQKKTFVLVEGTGHVGVGSIVYLNNAKVAKELKLPVILLASGGLGSAFDELTLNKALCDLEGVPILGVILNRVKKSKKAMIESYVQKALDRWNLPLLGCIPLDPLLSKPSFHDLESLFQGSFLSGEEFRQKHFEEIRLALGPVEIYRELLKENQLIITTALREDIILATLAKHWELHSMKKKVRAGVGLILTGKTPPKDFILEELKKAHLPVLYTTISSDEVLEKIHSFTAKIQKEDQEKIQEAIRLVEEHIDFDQLLKLL
jgi:dethiobiotin synthase